MLILVCILSQKIQALPLTETIYSIPEGEIEFSLQDQLYWLNNKYRVDQVGLGFGILPNLSLWFYSQFLNEGIPESTHSSIGDTFIKLMYYIKGTPDDSLHLGFMLKFRIPTGEDTYSLGRWRPVSFGNDEVKAGPVILYSLKNIFNLHLNILYLFREGAHEDFYGGFRLKLGKGETYKKIFGLNPFTEDSFLEKKRLRNDFIIISTAVNTGRLYPLIPYVEFQWSRRISPAGLPVNEPPISPMNKSPVLESVGMRYFFTGTAYAGIYSVLNPFHILDRGEFSAGLEIALQF